MLNNATCSLRQDVELWMHWNDRGGADKVRPRYKSVVVGRSMKQPGRIGHAERRAQWCRKRQGIQRGKVRLTRIRISNFRNFCDLDVVLDGSVVVVGENRVGKSNLLYALRLIFDPTLPDSARNLGLAGFWDGLGAPSDDDKIVVSVEIQDFEDDLDLLAVLTDFRLDADRTPFA